MHRTCKTCKKDKPYSEYHRNGAHLRPACKECSAKRRRRYYRQTRAKSRQASREHYAQNREKLNTATVARRYGLKPQQYLHLLASSNYSCQVCGVRPPKAQLHLDHCHSTGEVRGILCRGCNHALGNVKDNHSTLEKLAAYLKKFDE